MLDRFVKGCITKTVLHQENVFLHMSEHLLCSFYLRIMKNDFANCKYPPNPGCYNSQNSQQ